MPAGELAGGAEHRVGRGPRVPRLQIRHGLAMEEEEGGMEASEHEVVIVARIGNEASLVRGAGHVFAETPEDRKTDERIRAHLLGTHHGGMYTRSNDDQLLVKCQHGC
jgi:hypothetical protein